MKQYRGTYIILLVSLFLVGFGMLSYSLFDTKKDTEYFQISVIVNDNTSEHWTKIKQGIDQAALDYKVDINFIMLAEESDYKEQCALMLREMEDDADALVIVPADSVELLNTVKQVIEKIPVVTMMGEVHGDVSLDYISADNKQMGQTLGNMIRDQGEENKNILVLTDGREFSSTTKSYEGLMEQLNLGNYKINTVVKSEVGLLNEYQIKIKVELLHIDTVIALEPEDLEMIANAIDSYGLKLQLYGIGSTNKSAYYLEQGTVNSLVAQNEFSIGYLGIQAAVNAIKSDHKNEDTTIPFRVVNKENMYTSEIQKLLFPLIQ